LLDNAVADLAAISGQKPLVTKARKSVAGFKIRQGQMTSRLNRGSHEYVEQQL
jgi:ribosomal protein L5